MKWSGKRVLVTGAGGFIGSHLTERLVALGAKTSAFVHYRGNGSWGWLDNSPLKKHLTILAGDVQDPGFVDEAVKNVDVVFHLAALIGIPYSYVAPESYVRTNIQGTLNVLQAARKWGVEKVIHTSTSEAYGTARFVPISEEHPLQAQSPYSATKIAADKIAESFFLSFNVPVVTVRPFNTFGPRQSARAVIPTIIGQCLVGRKLKLGNLHPTRDLNFVDNTVDGFIRAAEIPAAIGQTINLGTGREIKIGELAKMIGHLLGVKVQFESDRARLRPKLSEVERLLADNRKARKILKWTPEVTLEQGLIRTIDWIQKNQHLYPADLYAV
ncbi:MAG: UDP-glucose 4-epimerase [Elusimicrobia bacterium]|nr:UDP-glucose 4-epimerase [Elusimicrobiota bacterium]